MKTVTTQKHQIHIPKKIRDIVGIEAYTPVRIATDGVSVLITPVRDSILDIAGTFKVKKPIKAEDIRKHLTYGEK